MKQDACSKQQAYISTFVASTEPPTALSISQQHPKQTKTFLTICPPVQRRILLRLVLPHNILMLVASPCGFSDCEGGNPGLHEARAESLAYLHVAGLRIAANLINLV